MDDCYSDVDSSTSEEMQPVVPKYRLRSPPSQPAAASTSEVYDLIVTSEMCEMLGKTKAELEVIAQRIETDMGVTRKSVLLAIPETIRIRYGIPARLNLWLSTLPQAAGLNTAGASSSAQSFASLLYVDGLNHGLRNDEITALIKTIVQEQRITSLYALLQLEENDLEHIIEPAETTSRETATNSHRLSPSVIYYIRRHLLKLKDDPHTSLSVRQVLTLLAGGSAPTDDPAALQDTGSTSARSTSARVVGKATSGCVKTPRPSHLSLADTTTPEWISETCVKLAERYNLHHIEQITRTLNTEDLKQIVRSEKLPFAAYLLLKRFCRRSAPSESLNRQLFTNPITYVEPTVEELIMRVGSHYGHPASETEAAQKILVDANWLTQLEHLRVVDKNYLTQLNLSPIFVDNLMSALKNPEILNMYQFDLSEVTQDDRIRIREAVDDLSHEVPNESRKLEVFQSFVRLFQHLILTPSDAAKRLVRKDNPIFRKTEPYQATHALLAAIGYVEYDDCFLLPVLHMEKTRYAHELLAAQCNDICKASQASSETLPELQRYVSSAWEAMRDQLSAAVGKGSA